MEQKPQRYARIDLAINLYPIGRSSQQQFKDVDAYPRAGSLDIVLPHAKGQQIISVGWAHVQGAYRVVETDANV